MIKKCLHIILLLSVLPVYATHNRAGEITFRLISGLTYEVTVTTYTDVSEPMNADRPSLEILWGDNTPLDSISRTSETILVLGSIKENRYIGQHTYPGPSSIPYNISVEDPNRNAGSVNVPNSVNVPFYIETELFINPFLGVNNSPVLLNPPIDNACSGSIFIHNPGAVDADGDSLSYSLQPSLGENGELIGGYQTPQATNSISIDELTGDLIWDSPIFQGEYNIAILIEEFRNGIKIGSVLRDMQITVVAGCPPPPVITGTIDTCVLVGENLRLEYEATGSSPITLTSTGLPYSLVPSAVFQQTTVPATITSANFIWQGACANVRRSPYTVSVKGVGSDQFNLADFHTTSILVIGPKPENLVTISGPNSVSLSWDRTICDQVLRYKIFRRLGRSGFVPDRCQTGLPASEGFELIATTSSVDDTSFIDNNNGSGLISGEEYCYRIVACYPDGAESIVSDESCVQLRRDVPIITKVSVDETSSTTGVMSTEWSRPTEFNAIQFQGPYRYLIYRGETPSNLTLIDSTATINDTTYIDSIALNTLNQEYFYRIDLYNLTGGSRDLIGRSTVASSVFLTLTPSDNQITLSWNEDVPWTNTEYIIFKQNPTTLIFDSIATTSNNSYVDTGLVNLVTQCYKIMSIGAYSSPGLINPILNDSQEACDQPEDNVFPCPPFLCVEVNCSQDQNRLEWTNQNTGCADDVLAFNIYRKTTLSADFEWVANIPNNGNATFSYLDDNLSSVIACYAITSLDSVGNESVLSDSVCINNPNGICGENIGCILNQEELVSSESCFIYRLPNVFTPGNDGFNDLFIPFPYRFVESIDLEVFNRWGGLVFKTNDPDILWNGENRITNQPSSDGTYFYTCTVNERCLEGLQSRVLNGFITLINTKKTTNP